MNIAHKNLKGLDEVKILAVLEPILQAHRLDAVELVWKGDQGGRVLELTLEKPGTTRSGEGITIDLCSEISRTFSEQLEELAIIPSNYRLEVGSPGVERALYTFDEFRRFAGQEIKIKLKEAMGEEGFVGQKSVRGVLFGIQDESDVLLSTDLGQLSIAWDRISSTRLVFSWNQSGKKNKRVKPLLNGGAKTRKKDREQ